MVCTVSRYHSCWGTPTGGAGTPTCRRPGRAALAQRAGLVRAQVGQPVEAPVDVEDADLPTTGLHHLVRPGREVVQPADDDLGHRRLPVRSIPKSSSAFSPKILRRCSSLN